MRRCEGFLTALLQLTMTFTLAHTSGATCMQEQVASCREAAGGHNLADMSGGGECRVNSYVHYTHECRVKDYLPSITFCCCELEAKVMCCRYHQDWDRFRCSEADDTIDQVPAVDLPLPLEMFLPAVLGPLLLAACCIFCCVKCLCQRHYAEDEEAGDCLGSFSCSDCCPSPSCSSKTCCSCCCSDSDSDRNHRGTTEKTGRPSPDEHVPLTYPNLMQQGSNSSTDGGVGSQSKLLHLSDLPRIEPSAPPASDHIFLNDDYVLYSGGVGSVGAGGGNNNPLDSTSNNHVASPAIYSTSPQHPLVCASCSHALLTPPPPPPTYEESEGQKVASEAGT